MDDGDIAIDYLTAYMGGGRDLGVEHGIPPLS
jgi:hypothetical protein